MKNGKGLLFAVLLLVASCSETPPLDFVPIHKAGDVGLYELNQEEQYTEKDSAASATIYTHMMMAVEDKVRQLNADGSVEFDVAYKRIKAEYEVSGKGKFLGDSDSPVAENPMNEGFARMKRQKINVVQDKRGHVLQVSGADSLFYGMYADSSYSSNDALKDILEAEAFFPGKPVKTGDSWTRKHSQKSYYPMTLSDSLTLLDHNDSIIRVGLVSRITANPQTKTVYDELGREADYEVEGSREGTYYINPKNFMVDSARVKMNLTGHKIIVATGEKIPIVVSRTETSTYKKLKAN